MTTIENPTFALETGAIGGARPATTGPAPPSAGLNGAWVDFPRDKCIHQFIEEQARRTPEATAVVFEDQRLTYRELNTRAEALAFALRQLGIGPDVPVGVCLERSLDMMVGLLGILKAGGCYVPLDPAYPKERLAFVLADARPPVLLTQTSLRRDLKSKFPNVKLLCVDDPEDHASRMNSESIRSTHQVPVPRSALRAPHSNNLAYIIYTSGSTGQPKGVMITHRNLANLFAGMDRVLGVKPGVWLAVTSISFDISALELFWTLARGFTVVIHSEGSRTGLQTNGIEQESIFDQILRHGVTHFQCTPSLAGNLIRTRGASEALQRLRTFLVGGEALPATLAAQLRQILRGDLINMYGPTETTVWSATHPVREVNGTVPIGHPIANTEIHILDGQLQPIAVGEPGEIFIGGEGVARGYLNRPELTAERFVPDPFSPDATARLYRTGDIGRFRTDGAIEFLGRADHQVKLHGHRIELGEIESALRQHTAVRECIVHVWEAGPDDKRLAAYVVPVNGSAPPAAELRRFLEPKLPGHMIPAAFLWLEKMPLTPNGKIDRNGLPKPETVRAEPAASYVAPQTPVQETIARIWRQSLRVEQVGVQDNFFDLGGTSLLLLEIYAQLTVALKVDFPIVRLFEHPTIAALAEFLATRETPALPSVHERALRQREAFARRQPQAVTS